jgi:hypothetical protein
MELFRVNVCSYFLTIYSIGREGLLISKRVLCDLVSIKRYHLFIRLYVRLNFMTWKWET